MVGLLQVLIRARFEPIPKCLGEFSGHSGFQMRFLATISSRRRPALLLQTKCAYLLSAPCVVIVLSDFLSLCDRFWFLVGFARVRRWAPVFAFVSLPSPLFGAGARHIFSYPVLGGTCAPGAPDQGGPHPRESL